ncbi:MAG: RecQ family ATP-dependent DNA helicase [Bacteroidetes bacterium]|nr:RecQ family ATP-dependent DNA helicase [Bacteroidota bacterium]
MVTPQEILHQYWGYTAFRPLQEEIIHAVLEGKDALAILPTGGGKSICFQVPAMMKDGICLVVSPLIALMKDQVENLKRKGINALAIYSGMSFMEVKKTLQNAAYGNYKFLYVSPERLETKLFLEYLPALNISLLAIDEAHCVSQWGYDFRPPYLRIANLRVMLPGIPVLALTASATKKVQDDICDKLSLPVNELPAKQNEWQRFQQSFERPNLSYSVFNPSSKQNKLLEIVQNVKGTGIVYCKSRKRTREIADLLRMNNISADYYHAGLTSEERTTKQENWIHNKIRIMVCTNAFGMGIDKPDVRVVVHYDVPDCLENYYQEAGRAGRDGKRAYAVLLYGNKELEELQEQVDIRFPGEEDIRTVYIALMNHFQVAAGIGEGLSYDLDLAVFTTAFKLNMLTTAYAIKILEQEDFLCYNEMIFKPATVLVTASRSDIESFEQTHPHLVTTIKGLLRSYEGIFDYPCTVYESQLAKFLKTEVNNVKQALQQLHDYGIVVYTPQKEKPQITLLKNRMYADSYAVNTNTSKIQKKNFEERVSAMNDYCRMTDLCRSTFIAQYFNAIAGACGICDNCINAKTNSLSKEEFEEIARIIFEAINDRPQPVQQIQQRLQHVKKEKLWKVIQYLQGEQKIMADKDGNIYK